MNIVLLYNMHLCQKKNAQSLRAVADSTGARVVEPYRTPALEWPANTPDGPAT